MKTIGIIGCGNMGGAIAAALSKDGSWHPVLYGRDKERTAKLAQTLGCDHRDDLGQLLESCTYLVLAVKPQVLPTLYGQLRECGSERNRWISIAAGVPLSVLSFELGTHEVARMMPNIAAKTGNSVTAVAFDGQASEETGKSAMEVASAIGSAFPLPENQFSAFIGISGSAIAYMFQFLHALAMGGVEQGIPYPTALEIARDTFFSAASLQKETGLSAIDLATKVCSAGGTTVRGMKALAEGAFDATVMSAVSASAVKNREFEALAEKH
jgi:pyrroline-5-carboxylate reductase